MGRDGAYNYFLALHPETKAFIASPNLATQRSSRSDISPRLMDRIGMTAVLDVIRSLKS
jgi:hypothetical protein